MIDRRNVILNRLYYDRCLSKVYDLMGQMAVLFEQINIPNMNKMVNEQKLCLLNEKLAVVNDRLSEIHLLMDDCFEHTHKD